ncbi:metallophosphoesterase [Luteolibacter sp. Populi]|uniref:metallophosphoesterase n=1 Tax=Luteolibacter sp. Populi TaxID=3230487 RepID=UPI0034672BCC
MLPGEKWRERIWLPSTRGEFSGSLESLKQGLVISDLHLFSPRACAEELLDRLAAELDRVDVLVLNGDTFDFRWSTLPCEAASIAGARSWLERWIRRFEGREIHYVVGNHDCLGTFREELKVLAAGSNVLTVHDSHVRLGSSLFLHGDCSNRGMNPARLAAYRKVWSKDRQRGIWGRRFYRVVDATGAGILFHRCYFQQAATVGRVTRYLDEALPGWRNGTSDCYFGHTHVPFRDHRDGEVRFHNTGSATRKMGFQPLRFDC